MSDKSAIEWTDATWNPVTGCTKVTLGCDNCYAERLAERFRGTPGHPFENGFDLTLRPERLRQPLSWKKPRRIFVNSMSDLFHKKIPPKFIDSVFDVMETANWHVFQILTKRSSLMKGYLQRRYRNHVAPPHIWCGVSVENHAASVRIRHLQRTPVQIRFLSIEPLLGPVGDIDLEGISWVIVGGESGPKARSMEQNWVLDIRDTCERKGVDFFFKQWGGLSSKSGGRQLQGIEYNAIPAYPAQTRKGTNMASFKWDPNGPPPPIESHSRAKLDVLRSYLRAYFNRLNVNPFREEFKLDLIDGFAGGGTFQDGHNLVSGTPLIMLEESKQAEERLNKRRTKPLHIDSKFYFVDKEAAHIAHLRKTLNNSEHKADLKKIVIRNNPFEEEIDTILKAIRRRQPRAGRAIFLLDQTGFSQVNLSLVARIFNELPAAEVILTFAADALINHLAETPEIIKATTPLQLTKSQIRKLVEYKNGMGGNALIQRALRVHTRAITGATYDTPFFIRPRKSRRALWFCHLSKHPVARNVMIECHWEIQNTFEHYGIGGFGMLGWDSLRDPETLSLFNFRDIDSNNMHKQLLKSMPEQLFNMLHDGPVTMDAIRHAFANETAARFLDLDKVILQLFKEQEFDVITPDGKIRSRTLKNLRSADRISLPDTPLLPGLSRLRR